MPSAQCTITSASMPNAQYFDYAVTELVVLSLATRSARLARSRSPREVSGRALQVPNFPFPISYSPFPIPHFPAN